MCIMTDTSTEGSNLQDECSAMTGMDLLFATRNRMKFTKCALYKLCFWSIKNELALLELLKFSLISYTNFQENLTHRHYFK